MFRIFPELNNRTHTEDYINKCERDWLNYRTHTEDYINNYERD